MKLSELLAELHEVYNTYGDIDCSFERQLNNVLTAETNNVLIHVSVNSDDLKATDLKFTLKFSGI